MCSYNVAVALMLRYNDLHACMYVYMYIHKYMQRKHQQKQEQFISLYKLSREHFVLTCIIFSEMFVITINTVCVKIIKVEERASTD